MRLNAKRYRELDKSATDIPLIFSLDVKPFLSHSGDTFLLKITFLDLLGEPVVRDKVAIDLLQDPNGTLDISRIRLDPTYESDRPWQMKYWRMRVNECLIAMKNSAMSSFAITGENSPSDHLSCSHDYHHTHPSPHMNEAANNNPSNSNPKSGTSGFSSVSLYKSPHRFHHGHHGHHSYHRAYYRYLRQAILPGVLGMMAALIACGIGFAVGKASISLYLHFKDNKERAKNRMKRKDVEDGDADEKQRLLIISRGTM